MADYKETSIIGKKWRRCYGIVIENPVAPGRPTITFHEEDVVETDGMPFRVGLSQFKLDFDPQNLITVLNPETLEPVGTSAIEADIYMLLFSRYIAAARERDTAAAIKEAELAKEAAEQLALKQRYDAANNS